MDYSNMTLMEAILKSGYPPQDISHHESDLYVFVTKETTQVINDWFKQHHMNQDLFVSKFKDQITGRLMYDLAFAFALIGKKNATSIRTRIHGRRIIRSGNPSRKS